MPARRLCYSNRIVGHRLREGDAFAQYTHASGWWLFPKTPVGKERSRFPVIEQSKDPLPLAGNSILEKRRPFEIPDLMIQSHKFVLIVSI